MIPATRNNNSARSVAGVFFHVSRAFAASSTARFASSLVALLKRPTTCVRFAGLILSSMSPVVMRSPPITSGYSRPSSLWTFLSASRIASAFSSLVKSVNGSLRNSEDIFSSYLLAADKRGFSRFEPRKSAFICGLHLIPLACFLQLPDLAFDDLALDGAHLVEKHDAVAVICFMQHAARGQFHAVELEPLTLEILRAYNRSQVPLDRREDSREG